MLKNGAVGLKTVGWSYWEPLARFRCPILIVPYVFPSIGRVSGRLTFYLCFKWNGIPQWVLTFEAKLYHFKCIRGNTPTNERRHHITLGPKNRGAPLAKYVLSYWAQFDVIIDEMVNC